MFTRALLSIVLMAAGAASASSVEQPPDAPRGSIRLISPDDANTSGAPFASSAFIRLVRASDPVPPELGNASPLAIQLIAPPDPIPGIVLTYPLPPNPPLQLITPPG